jgi:hypothetical protein
MSITECGDDSKKALISERERLQLRIDGLMKQIASYYEDNICLQTQINQAIQYKFI